MGYDIIKLKTLIVESGIPIKEFLKPYGISEKTLDKWINKSLVPRDDLIKKMATQLDVPLKDIRLTDEVFPLKQSLDIEQKTTFVSNFLFLKEEFYSIYKAGSNAEEYYIRGQIKDDEVCINLLGSLAEGLVNALLNEIEATYFDDVLFPNLRSTQKYRINYLWEKREITYLEYDLFHKIRNARNITVISHHHEDENKKEIHEKTLLLLKDAFKVACLFAKRFNISYPKHFITPFANERNHEEKSTLPSQSFSLKELDKKRSEAIGRKNYNDIIIYSIIKRDGHTVDKFKSFCTEKVYRDLAELFLCIRRKRTVPSLENFSYARHRDILKEDYPPEVVAELNSLFISEYRAALNDLVGQIKEIAGELE